MYPLHLSQHLHRFTTTTSISFKTSDSSTTAALTVSTNSLAHTVSIGHKHQPRFAVAPSKKASATVSLTNANISRSCHLPSGGLPDPSDQSCIPFPSTPIACPDGRPDEEVNIDLSSLVISEQPLDPALELLPDEPWPQQSSDASTPWHIELFRKRSKSCLASSYVHRDGHAFPTIQSETPKIHKLDMKLSGGVRKRKLAGKKPKVLNSKVGKKPRKGRKHVADLKFAAMLHRSIAWHIRCAQDAHRQTQGDHASPFQEQDELLVERLWRSLVDQGMSPVPLNAERPPHHLMSPMKRSSPQPSVNSMETIENASANPSSPPSRSLEPLIIPSAPSTPPPSPTNSPTSSLPLGDSQVLPMPQLVAALIMRHRDRTAFRPRSPSNPEERASKPCSPLSKTVVLPASVTV